MNGQEFRVFEVGGTYSERLKWVHAFEDVDVLIFLASSNGSTGESDQDQTMVGSDLEYSNTNGVDTKLVDTGIHATLREPLDIQMVCLSSEIPRSHKV